MRASTTTVGAVVLGFVLTALVAVPGTAATWDVGILRAGTPCHDEDLSVRVLGTGCSVDGGTLTLDDGRTFVVPSAGVRVSAEPVSASDHDHDDVVVVNRGRAGVAVMVDDVWRGSPTAVRQERAAVQQRTRAVGLATTGPGRHVGTTASCGSTAYTLTGAHWESTIDWRYNPSGARVAKPDAVQAGAQAWTGKVGACGETVRSSVTQRYLGTAKQAAAVTDRGGCGASSGTSVVGWGPLPGLTLALTCTWSWTDGVAFETDQRYSTKQLWSSTATCSGSRYDLRGIATHEWGHSVGLGHTAQRSGLVMKPSSTVCDTAQRTLGLGDLRGLAALSRR
ncbi:matrixin family metalloprotease [Curtobacterium sp. MCLR17_036]|uniref:matrixin family metalloprotease n=1 Tax=Curtobacterium sp. MCLR17_036 TaxID=2175620 RepID=UPI000DA6FCA8|nr:matrixin family metalloprotease [Curtobacterium sp. MCLR17_036]WIE64973.1 matrixin family metalloprotease [Curtobacterium sp. MCLR17_036]